MDSSSFFYSLAIILVSLSTLPKSECSSVSQNNTEYLALLAFKDRIHSDPLGTLRSWNDAIHLCRWQGIKCSNESERVIALNLQSCRITGSMSPFLGNLTFLNELNLGDNSLHGEIPPEIGNLNNLRILNLSSNSFSGRIPSNISNCKGLVYLDLAQNNLIGEIPAEITTLKRLETLYLLVNNLTGAVPSSIGNLSALTTLAMGRNSLTGILPPSIGFIPTLDFLQIAENQLSGVLPSSIYNVSSLTFIALASNHLQGELPADIAFTLPNLDTLYLGGNQMTGSFPLSLTNMSKLVNLDLAENNFIGSVPADLGKLNGLIWLNFEGNQLGIGDVNGLDFINSLSNCSNLETLVINDNSFEGQLPVSIGNLSTKLSMLNVAGNKIRGGIPEGITNFIRLTSLYMQKNVLTGSIPYSIGRLTSLQLLNVFQNRLSGPIPSSLGNLTQLNDLRLNSNLLQGSIPPSLGNCKSLAALDLSQNKISGMIPPQVIDISSLTVFLGLAHNSLIGYLPAEVGNLKNLKEMDISENKLSGEIPQTIGNCESMEYLRMQGNILQGTIPTSLSKLKGIRYIDLSRNNLSGQIPEYLGDLHLLENLNLSWNDFEGLVPSSGVFGNASAVEFQGNTKLCGGASVLQLPTCPTKTAKKEKKTKVMHIIIPLVCAASALAILSCLYLLVRCRKRSMTRPPIMFSPLGEPYIVVSYKELFDATNGFSTENMIGKGSYGTVYRGILSRIAEVVAVKVLDLEHGAPKSFLAECEVLRHIRHRNLIKILTACSSVDFQGNAFKALVFEFMHNRSLEELLHPNVQEQHHFKFLNITDRLNISIDVASALDYLHHQCQAPIVHCDLKPSNVLLDEDMTAHVGDFGLAKILLRDTMESQSQTKSIGIRGSIGYVPPEYGTGAEVSIYGDVYSYGILLLEIFTGKRPTDEIFNDGFSLHSFAKKAHPKQVMEIIDPQMLLESKKPSETTWEDGNVCSRIQECLASVIGISLSCSAESPWERPEMRDVAGKLEGIRAKFLAGHENRQKIF